MALAETAELAVHLKLDDDMTPGLRKVDKSVQGLGGSMGKAGAGVKSFAGTLVKAGAVATGVLAGGLVLAIKGGLNDLATLETATTSVTGAIKQMGLAGKVTAGQVATWANEIESDIGAAFDDKDITAATATLIRFGKLAPQNIRPAMVVMTDLAVKTGSVASASTLLARALADPTKAAGKLARAGVILTKSQQAQIKALVKAGKAGEAQKLILDAVAKSTKGAALASQGPYQRALSTLADASEDARKALAEGFLPVIERVAGKLSKIVADPKAIASIREFGKTLADGFDSAVKFAEGIDWGAVTAGLKSAATWAGRLFGAFQALPPETKGILIGLAGLTKLTGGAPIKIAVDFAKDALSGVFGHFFERGSSPANPLFVTGIGEGGGGGPGVPGGGGFKDLLGGLLAGAGAVAVGEAMNSISATLTTSLSAAFGASGTPLANTLDAVGQQLSPLQGIATTLTTLDTIPAKLALIPGELGQIADFFTGHHDPVTPGLTGGAPGRGGATPQGSLTGHAGPGRGASTGVAAVATLSSKIVAAEKAVERAVRAGHPAEAARLRAKLDELKGEEARLKTTMGGKLANIHHTSIANLSAARAIAADTRHAGSVTAGKLNSVNGKLSGANAKLDAIRHKRTKFSVHTNVNVNTRVSVSELQRQARYSSRVARSTSLSAS